MSRIEITIDGRPFEVELNLDQGTASDLTVTVNGESLPVILPDPGAPPDQMEWIIVGNRPYDVTIDRDLHWMRADGRLHRLGVRDLNSAVARAVGRDGRMRAIRQQQIRARAAEVSRLVSRDGRVRAPIPGLIVRVSVSEGDRVEAGQPLLVLEAMKMENEIQAPCSGLVRQVHVHSGQEVALHEVLVEIV